MVLSDNFFDEMKAYFVEQGKEYNALILEYIHLIKELRCKAICQGKTAEGLDNFLMYLRKLENVTEDIASYTNCAIQIFIEKVNDYDKANSFVSAFEMYSERNFSEEYEQSVCDELNNKMNNWKELDLHPYPVAHWNSTLGIDRIMDSVQDYRDDIINEMTKDRDEFCSIVGIVNLYDRLYVDDYICDIHSALEQLKTYIKELGNSIDHKKGQFDMNKKVLLQSMWNEYFTYYDITREKLIYDKGGNRPELAKIPMYKKQCIIEDFERDHPEYKQALERTLSTGEPNVLTEEDKCNIKYIVYTAPEPYRTIYLENLSYCEFYCIGDEIGKNGYSEEEQKIVIGENGSSLMDRVTGPYMSIFHESAHAIDYRNSYIDGEYFCDTYATSSSSLNVVKESTGKEKVTLQDAIYYDVYHNIETRIRREGIEDEDSIERILDSFRYDKVDSVELSEEEANVKKSILNYYKEKLCDEENAAASDVYGGVTNLIIYVEGGGVHEPEDGNMETFWYWYNADGTATYNQARELWAEYFASCLTEDKEALQSIEMYFPEASKVLQEITTQLKEETHA